MSVNDTSRTCPDDKRGTYIRPQKGLSLGKSGGVVQVNLENIGGRILVLAERCTHKNRMKSIKPVVNVKPPWGHEAKSRGKISKNEMSGKRRIRPQSASRMPTPSVRDFDQTSLPDCDNEIVKNFMNLLGTLSTDAARSLVEYAYRETEEHRLLQCYSGVFPELADSDAEESTPPPAHPPSAAVTAINNNNNFSSTASSVEARSPALSPTSQTASTFPSPSASALSE